MKSISKYILFFSILLIVGICSFARISQPFIYCLQLPATNPAERLITYKAYTVSYNHATLNPNWVAYELTADESDGPVNRKGRRFIPDPKVTGPQAENDDYRNSGWSRGHMAPAADMKWDSVAMDECFYFTNCCPQDATFNDGKWHSLEKKTRAIAKQYGRVYVVTGPIVGKNVNGTIGENRVVVPDAFFKAWLVPVNGTYSAIGFVLYNSSEDQNISASACTIDELELLTGLDFYHNLDDKTEMRVEASIDWKYWKGVGIVP